MSNTKSKRVQIAKRLLVEGRVYLQGCSGFVCEVLGVPWEEANSLLGQDAHSVGSGNDYSGVEPGDVVGWTRPGTMGHVAIYIGEPGMKLIDVPGPGKRPRKLVNGYGGQMLHSSSKY
ncbi:NlpC/P60 family protein [Paraliomyxa miuraensis]|uniref:hypothetical protein n=1 Tax=Paraliomyxa miuraensis TaxID=376150 RepID=UPI00225619FE|nr:hypothetical protein [Paraliomyxa miuraensis]MCX4242403.1 hypothetical protein [Paraliomyxa miuraensis]